MIKSAFAVAMVASISGSIPDTQTPPRLTEIAPKVLATDKAMANSKFIIPANMSRTGRDEPIEFRVGTILVAPGDGFFDREKKDRPLLRRIVKTFNLDSVGFRTMLAINGKNPPFEVTQYVGAFINHQSGYETPRTNSIYLENSQIGIKVINVGKPDYKTWYAETLTGYKVSDLNLSAEELSAMNARGIAHETYHWRADNWHLRNKDANALGEEIQADHRSLQRYFKPEFIQLIMRFRALESLNVTLDSSPAVHSSHIWVEEFNKQAVPTEDEAKGIIAAPPKLRWAAVDLMREVWPDFKKEEIDREIQNNPILRYLCMQKLLEDGSLKKIPYGEEFAEKYIAAFDALIKLEAKMRDMAPYNNIFANIVMVEPGKYIMGSINIASNEPIPQ